MSKFAYSWKRASLLGCASVLALGVTPALGFAAASDNEPAETIVVTGTRFDTDAAPAKASLDTTEPQTIINRSFIQNFLPPQSDYVTILAIVPSMTGGDPNGPGLSDGGAKNTLRGLPDGSFAQQYDDIPFGDTNGPTHHNISYFPASTIGSAVVDRGPGNAGNLGAATYGGTVKLFSQTLTHDFQASGLVGYGSFDTEIGIANAQTGDIKLSNDVTTRVLVNLQGLRSDGALTLQNVDTQNALVKVETDIGPKWTVTLFSDFSYLDEHLDDNNGLTPAQVQVYGKNFALQNTDPTLPTYVNYNWTSKQTDMEYVKEVGSITDSLKLQNTSYTYAYWNHTFSPNSQTQTLAQIQADSSSDNGTVTLENGKKLTNSLLAYDKVNAYRVYGDVFRLSQDYTIGPVSGEVRVGAWLESQTTHRYKYYFDANLCTADGANPFGSEGAVAATAQCGAIKGSASNGTLGYGKDDEYSSWNQYEPFMEVDIKPIDDLVITPGVKYVHWDHKVDAPIAQGSTCGVSLACPGFNALGQNYQSSFVTTDTLPFAQVNYKIKQNWSVYAEYAKGIYVPDVSAFEQNPPTATFPRPETTTNYQVGTVFYADNFTFDADVYYIPINNNYVSQTCSFDHSESCYVNNGSATYKGIEGEGTYAFDKVGGLDLKGMSVFVNGAIMSSKQGNGNWEPNAPRWTAAAGLLFQQNGWKFSVIDKIIGRQYSDSANVSIYELPSYSDISLTAGYAFENVELGVTLDNLLNTRATTSITEATNGVASPNPATSLDQYIFQAPLSVMATLRVHY
jgi:iron complex outermembrane receptor protein